MKSQKLRILRDQHTQLQVELNFLQRKLEKLWLDAPCLDPMCRLQKTEFVVGDFSSEQEKQFMLKNPLQS